MRGSIVHASIPYTRLQADPMYRIRFNFPAFPDGKFILNKKTKAIGNLIPSFRRKANTISYAVPFQFLKPRMKFGNPFLVPWQIGPFRVFKETENTNIGSSHEIGFIIK